MPANDYEIDPWAPVVELPQKRLRPGERPFQGDVVVPPDPRLRHENNWAQRSLDLERRGQQNAGPQVEHVPGWLGQQLRKDYANREDTGEDMEERTRRSNEAMRATADERSARHYGDQLTPEEEEMFRNAPYAEVAPLPPGGGKIGLSPNVQPPPRPAPGGFSGRPMRYDPVLPPFDDDPIVPVPSEWGQWDPIEDHPFKGRPLPPPQRDPRRSFGRGSAARPGR